MADQSQLALTFASDLAKQIMTLSTAVITATISFTRDLVAGASPRAVGYLRRSWGCLLSSLVFGVWTLMALTGSLVKKHLNGSAVELLGVNVRLPAALQILSFLLGLLFLIRFGRSALLGKPGKAP